MSEICKAILKKAMNVLKFLSFVVSVYTLAASVAGAAAFEPWTYKGKISWKHPSGKNIVGRFVETSVDDDILRIIREAGTGEYFAEMQLIGNGSHLSEPAHFFVLDAPKIAGAVKLAKVAASVWPNPGGNGGSIVAELPTAHLDAWKAGSGNLMGVTYIFGNSSSLSNFKTYYFSGKNFGDALDQLEKSAAADNTPSSDETFLYLADLLTRELPRLRYRDGHNANVRRITSSSSTFEIGVFYREVSDIIPFNQIGEINLITRLDENNSCSGPTKGTYVDLYLRCANNLSCVNADRFHERIPPLKDAFLAFCSDTVGRQAARNAARSIKLLSESNGHSVEFSDPNTVKSFFE